MKVLITANTSWYIWNFRRSLIQALQKDGHEIIIAAPEDDYTDRITALGCQFAPLKIDNKGTSPLRDFALYRHLRGLFRGQQLDVVFSYTIKCNIYACMAARPLKLPVIPNVSGLGTAFLSENWVNRVVKRLYRSAFRVPNVIFFQNRDDQETFLGLGLATEGQARLLPGSGVDLKRFGPQPLPATGEVTFLLIARLLWDKGVGEFVAAATQIRRDHPNTRFQLLGFLNAENRSAIPRETVEDWVRKGIVEYLGATDDVRPHIAAADCVVLPSYYPEGTPRSLLEAASMARPIITTDTPGCRDVVEEGITGFLCDPRNKESLKEVIERVVALSPQDRSDMGLRGRLKMEREFDQVTVITAYRQVIAELSAIG